MAVDRRVQRPLLGGCAGDGDDFTGSASLHLQGVEIHGVGDGLAIVAESPHHFRFTRALKRDGQDTGIAVVCGGSGIGKTYAARQYASTGAHAWIATMTPATSGVVPALEEVCAAIGIPAANGAAPLHRAIVQRITGTAGLLIVDEAQHLIPAALDQLRGIHDAGAIGLVLLGSRDLHTRMTGGEAATTLERLRGRIGRRLALGTSTASDAEALAEACGVPVGGARKLLGEVATKAGGLRSVVKLLRVAMIHSPGAAPFTEASLRTAWRDLAG